MTVATPTSPGFAQQPHNVILFVADGLRPGMVNAQTAPALTDLLKKGVHFTNTHAMFPTFTTANAASLATSHKVGDTGDFGNTIDVGFPVPGAGNSLTPFLESDPVLGDVDEHFSGDYLNQETVMRAARAAGLSSATIGKLGPTLIFDHTERSGEQTIVVDDSTGRAGGIPLAAEMQKRLTAAGLDLQAPTRGDNGNAGNFQTPGTLVANTVQQDYFVKVTTKVVLPWFKERAKPFMLILWSRDPDGTQHNQGDSLGRLLPGINGPTSLAAIRNADDNLAALLAALKELGLDATTDVIVTADHGFATISKESATSFAATQSYKDVPPHLLPPGFLAIDIAHGLGMPLIDPDNKYQEVAAGSHPSRGDGLIGADKAKPDVVVAANGGSDLVYLPTGDKVLARRVVDILAAQDYVSGLFVSDELGPIPGTLPISAIDLKGSAVTPLPAIVVNFRTFSTGAPIRSPVRSRSQIPSCSRGRACMARSAAPIRSLSAAPWGPISARVSSIPRRPAMPTSAGPWRQSSACGSATRESWLVACSAKRCRTERRPTGRRACKYRRPMPPDAGPSFTPNMSATRGT